MELEYIVRKIAFNVMKEPGTKVEALSDESFWKKGNIFTVESNNFPWLRFKEMPDGWWVTDFKRVES